MTQSRIRRVFLVVGLALLLAACAAGPNNVTHVNAPEIAGFWLGLWHGLISPITFLISLFNANVSIYEVHNNGNWYDFGFMIGIATIFGSSHSGRLARSRRPSKSGRHDTH